MRLLWLLFWLLPLALAGQDPGYWHLTDREGLPSNSVYSIGEDSNGYLYLGTPGGLVRFNGFRFEVIPNPDARSADVSDIQVAPDGAVWFSNFHHELFRYTRQTGIRRFREVNKSNFNPSGSYFLDARGNAWFNNNQSLYRLESSTGKVFGTGISQKYWQSMVRMGEQGFFGTAGYDAWQVKFGAYPELLQKRFPGRPFERAGVRKLLYSKKLELVCMALAEYSGLPADVRSIALGNYPMIRAVNSYGMFRNGSVWLATAEGIAIFDETGEPTFDDRLLLQGFNASTAFLDSRGNYWFGTLNDGLYMVGGLQIRNYVYHTPNHLLNGVYSLRFINGRLFAGMQNGDIHMFSRDGQIQSWSSGLNRSVIFISGIPGSDKLLLNAHLYQPGSNSGNMLQFLGSPKGCAFDDDHLLLANNVGVIYVKTESLFGFIPNNDSVEFLFNTINETGTVLKQEMVMVKGGQLLSGRSGKVYKDGVGRIWISGPAGFYYLKGRTLSKIELTGSGGAMAADFCDDGQGVAYVFLQGKGLYKYDGKRTEQMFGNVSMLQTTGCRRMLFSGGRVWIATMKGLICADPASGNVFAVRINDGLLSNDIQDIAEFNGKMWVATLRGISTLPINYKPSPRPAPKPFIHRVEVNESPLTLVGSQELAYDENTIRFVFDAIDFRSRDLLVYKYRLRGLSDGWIESDGSRNFALFQGLPPGKYVFELLAVNDQGAASAEPVKFAFTVHLPWWKQWWFILLALASLALLAYFTTAAVVRQRRKKEKMEQELRISQLTSLKAQMNPHFMFNALNSIQDFILLNDKVSANTYLGKFSDLMRMVLDMSNRQTITLANEIKALQLYLDLEAVRFEDTLHYEVKIAGDLDPAEWELPSMIIQPFVENAVKHGLLHKRTDRRLKVEFTKSPDAGMLHVMIEDNGVGRAEAQRINSNRQRRHTSFATGATDRRLKLLNQDKNKVQIRYTDLHDEHGQPCGTRVELDIDMAQR